MKKIKHPINAYYLTSHIKFDNLKIKLIVHYLPRNLLATEIIIIYFTNSGMTAFDFNIIILEQVVLPLLIIINSVKV